MTSSINDFTISVSLPRSRKNLPRMPYESEDGNYEWVYLDGCEKAENGWIKKRGPKPSKLTAWMQAAFDIRDAEYNKTRWAKLSVCIGGREEVVEVDRRWFIQNIGIDPIEGQEKVHKAIQEIAFKNFLSRRETSRGMQPILYAFPVLEKLIREFSDCTNQKVRMVAETFFSSLKRPASRKIIFPVINSLIIRDEAIALENRSKFLNQILPLWVEYSSLNKGENFPLLEDLYSISTDLLATDAKQIINCFLELIDSDETAHLERNKVWDLFLTLFQTCQNSEIKWDLEEVLIVIRHTWSMYLQLDLEDADLKKMATLMFLFFQKERRCPDELRSSYWTLWVKHMRNVEDPVRALNMFSIGRIVSGLGVSESSQLKLFELGVMLLAEASEIEIGQIHYYINHHKELVGKYSQEEWVWVCSSVILIQRQCPSLSIEKQYAFFQKLWSLSNPKKPLIKSEMAFKIIDWVNKNPSVMRSPSLAASGLPLPLQIVPKEEGREIKILLGEISRKGVYQERFKMRLSSYIDYELGVNRLSLIRSANSFLDKAVREREAKVLQTLSSSEGFMRPIRSANFLIEGTIHQELIFEGAQLLANLETHLWSFEKRKSVGSQILDAVFLLHSHGIVHRNLHPTTIFISTLSGRSIVKIGHLGACLLPEEVEEGRRDVEMEFLPACCLEEIAPPKKKKIVQESHEKIFDVEEWEVIGDLLPPKPDVFYYSEKSTKYDIWSLGVLFKDLFKAEIELNPDFDFLVNKKMLENDPEKRANIEEVIEMFDNLFFDAIEA